MQVQLPASVGSELMAQDASKNGSIFFELRTASGATTHASVLDYTAPEGTVTLPEQTSHSLFGAQTGAHGTLQVTYTTLPKGELLRNFQTTVTSMPGHSKTSSQAQWEPPDKNSAILPCSLRYLHNPCFPLPALALFPCQHSHHLADFLCTEAFA